MHNCDEYMFRGCSLYNTSAKCCISYIECINADMMKNTIIIVHVIKNYTVLFNLLISMVNIQDFADS